MLAAAYCDNLKPRISRGMVRLDEATHHGRGEEGGGERGSPRANSSAKRRVGGIFRGF